MWHWSAGTDPWAIQVALVPDEVGVEINLRVERNEGDISGVPGGEVPVGGGEDDADNWVDDPLSEDEEEENEDGKELDGEGDGEVNEENPNGAGEGAAEGAWAAQELLELPENLFGVFAEEFGAGWINELLQEPDVPQSFIDSVTGAHLAPGATHLSNPHQTPLQTHQINSQVAPVAPEPPTPPQLHPLPRCSDSLHLPPHLPHHPNSFPSSFSSSSSSSSLSGSSTQLSSLSSFSPHEPLSEIPHLRLPHFPQPLSLSLLLPHQGSMLPERPQDPSIQANVALPICILSHSESYNFSESARLRMTPPHYY